MWASMEITK
jgi:hypothetical protein